MNKVLLLLAVIFLSACTKLDAQSTPANFTLEPTISEVNMASPSQELPEPATTNGIPTEKSLQVTEEAGENNQPNQNHPNYWLPDASAFTWQLISGGLNQPVFITGAGDGTGRLFILEQPGTVKVIQNGILLDQPFLDIRERIGNSSSEQGLLGIVFHPEFKSNGRFFINYTNLSGDTVISRFSTTDETFLSGNPASEEILLQIKQPYPNHNGGMLAFGPDGYLYIGTGDGGSANDPGKNAQSLGTLLGKILRINVDIGEPYSTPNDNAFVSQDALPEIWAYGLRNPWRFDFDTLSGDLYIGDVGQNQWEEINFLPAGTSSGENLGWNVFEGNHPTGLLPQTNANYMAPIAEYDHSKGCSVTGGVVYRGLDLPEWDGVYLYGDYCTGKVWGLIRDQNGVWQNAELFSGLGLISSFGKDDSGEIYLVNHRGEIYKMIRR